MKQSKKIAISGIATAMASVFLVLGNYLSVLDYSFYILSSICLILPFITKEWWWSVLSLIATSVIGFLLAPNLMQMMIYVLYFAPYAIILGFTLIFNVKPTIAYIVKEVFYAISITLMYFFSTVFVEVNEWNLPLWTLILGAIILMNVYDFCMQRIARTSLKTLYKIIKN